MRTNLLKKLILSLGLGVAGLGVHNAQAAAEFRTGSLKVEIWSGVGGTALSALTGDPRYPSNPSETRFVKFAEFPAGADDGTQPAGDVMNDYGAKISGFILPKTTGNYIFFIAADDNAGLWLSTDDTPAKLTQIASEPQWNQVRTWTSTSRRPGCPDNGGAKCENRSNPIRLEAGKRYYMEALVKEGGGGDNLAVTMIKEGDADPINSDPPTLTGDLIGTFVELTVAIITQPQDVKTEDGNIVSFSVSASAAVGTTYQWSKNGTAIAGATSATYTPPNVTLADNGAKFKVKVAAANSVDSREAVLTVVAKDRSANIKGFLRADYYTGITGTALDALRNDPKYPNSPDVVEYVNLAESRTGFGDNYGVKLSGWIIPAETASYQFVIAADDNAELYLSTDDTPAKAVVIASEPQWNGARAFGTTARRPGCPDACENVSGPVRLEAGKRYYLEALAKEGGGGDNLAVTWFREGGTKPADGAMPLASSFLETVSNKNLASDITITQQPQSATAQVNTSASLSVAATITPATQTTYIWHKNGRPIPGATTTSYAIKAVRTADAGDYTCVISVVGRSATTAVAKLTVEPDRTPPTPVLAVLKKGANQEVGVSFNEPVDSATAGAAANYSVTGGTLQKVEVVTRSTANFSADLPSKVPEYTGVKLIVSGVNAGQQFGVTVRNVKDLNGNAIATPVTVNLTAEAAKTWAVIGVNESGFANDVVRVGDQGFDIVSSGVAFWSDYDEATFVYEEITGNFDKVVQLEYQDPSSQWARTGLMAREALDEGRARPDRGACTQALENDRTTYCVAKTQLFSRFQTVHANPHIRWDNGVANNNYENHWRAEDTLVRDFGNQMQSADGAGGPLNYPDVWMRLRRDGNFLVTYRSTDGGTWTQMTRREFANLTPKLYVGPFLAPELGNNDTRTGLGHAVMARFRNYHDFSTAPPPSGGSKIAFEKTATGLKLTYSGTLQSADNVAGPYADVAGATNPATIPLSGAAKFYRAKQ